MILLLVVVGCDSDPSPTVSLDSLRCVAAEYRTVAGILILYVNTQTSIQSQFNQPHDDAVSGVTSLIDSFIIHYPHYRTPEREEEQEAT